MIVTSQLIWLHIPKTAGTTTDALFKASGIPLLWRDSQKDRLKHLPSHEHPDADSLELSNKHKITNFRRLPYWLLSNLQHKQRLMGLELEQAPIRQGLFWREREQQWLPADWWLERFSVTPDWPLIRVEHLKADFLHIVSQHENISQLNKWRIQAAPELNKNQYSRSLKQWFGDSDLKRMYAANPFWSLLEKQHYGHLLIDR